MIWKLSNNYNIVESGVNHHKPTNHSFTVEHRCLELEGTTRKYSSYPRFDLSEIDYDVSCFIDKGSDVCFHHV
jgi:hypothetical protein